MKTEIARANSGCEVGVFVRVYVAPAILDGKVTDAEDGVLAAGFRLCGLTAPFVREETRVIRELDATIHSVLRDKASWTCTVEAVASAWDLFLDRYTTLSLGDAFKVVDWLENLLVRLRYQPHRVPFEAGRFSRHRWQTILSLGSEPKVWECLTTLVPELKDQLRLDRSRGLGVHPSLMIRRAKAATVSPTYARWRKDWLGPLLETWDTEQERSPAVVDASVERRQTLPKGAAPLPSRPVANIVGFDARELSLLGQRIQQARDRSHLRATIDAMGLFLGERTPPGLAFDECRAAVGQKAVAVDAGDLSDRQLWFIGDLHGDLLALETALLHVERSSTVRRPIVIFLGDLIDDGPDSLEVIARIFEQVTAAPDAYCILTGNHDAALRFDGETFASDVSPSDFGDWLSVHPDDGLASELGRLAIQFSTITPRALFLSDGLVIAHGGIPLSDLHTGIKSLADLNSPECLQDFMWTRAHHRAPKKLPNRNSKGAQFGWADFDAFRAVASRAVGFPVERMIRGHDHVEERFCVYPDYPEPRLVTINSLYHRLGREFGGEYVRMPCVARYEPGGLLAIDRLSLPEDLVRETYPEPEEA